MKGSDLVMTFSCALFCAVTGAATAADAPPAKSCTLVRYASLPLTTEADGRVSVPVKFNDRMVQMVVDTGGMFGGLSSTISDSMGLKRKPFPFGSEFVFYGRVAENEYVSLDHFVLGEIDSKQFEIPLMPNSMLDSDVHGLMGGNILSVFDVEIDFLNEKMNLFSPDHCPGHVVYWTKGAYARVPLDIDRGWHITVPVVIDGKSFKAVVDTGAAGSVMTFEHASSVFDWDEKTAPTAEPNGYMRGPFATMTFEGIQVSHPEIQLMPKKSVARGAPELLLGVNVLRQLHLYIAYQEKMLYLSPAEEPPTPAALPAK